ncbi:unnamed protein product [Amoebophrya sp. A25]|nr:unnamed protein product [Amoebophrya sp. A25]|eukprot:GSA25T00006131001.1
MEFKSDKDFGICLRELCATASQLVGAAARTRSGVVVNEDGASGAADASTEALLADVEACRKELRGEFFRQDHVDDAVDPGHKINRCLRTLEPEPPRTSSREDVDQRILQLCSARDGQLQPLREVASSTPSGTSRSCYVPAHSFLQDVDVRKNGASAATSNARPQDYWSVKNFLPSNDAHAARMEAEAQAESRRLALLDASREMKKRNMKSRSVHQHVILSSDDDDVPPDGEDPLAEADGAHELLDKKGSDKKLQKSDAAIAENHRREDKIGKSSASDENIQVTAAPALGVTSTESNEGFGVEEQKDDDPLSAHLASLGFDSNSDSCSPSEERRNATLRTMKEILKDKEGIQNDINDKRNGGRYPGVLSRSSRNSGCVDVRATPEEVDKREIIGQNVEPEEVQLRTPVHPHTTEIASLNPQRDWPSRDRVEADIAAYERGDYNFKPKRLEILFGGSTSATSNSKQNKNQKYKAPSSSGSRCGNMNKLETYFTVPNLQVGQPGKQGSKSETGQLQECPEDLQIVRSAEAMQAMVAELATEDAVAIDIEHHSQHSFRGFCCLLQLSSKEKDWIVDLIPPTSHVSDETSSSRTAYSEFRTSVSLLNKITADASIVKVLHGADHDVLWLQRDFGVYLVNLFDTGQATRVLRYPGGFGLANLYTQEIGFLPDKSLQLADWRERPLARNLLNYARSDTHFLLYVYLCLLRQIYATTGEDGGGEPQGSGEADGAKSYGSSGLRIFNKKKQAHSAAEDVNNDTELDTETRSARTSIVSSSRKAERVPEALKETFARSQKVALSMYHVKNPFPVPRQYLRAEAGRISTRHQIHGGGGVWNPTQMGRLETLLEWRDCVARALDVSEHAVLPTASLVQLSQMPIEMVGEKTKKQIGISYFAEDSTDEQIEARFRSEFSRAIEKTDIVVRPVVKAESETLFRVWRLGSMENRGARATAVLRILVERYLQVQEDSTSSSSIEEVDHNEAVADSAAKRRRITNDNRKTASEKDVKQKHEAAAPSTSALGGSLGRDAEQEQHNTLALIVSRGKKSGILWLDHTSCKVDVSSFVSEQPQAQTTSSSAPTSIAVTSSTALSSSTGRTFSSSSTSGLADFFALARARSLLHAWREREALAKKIVEAEDSSSSEEEEDEVEARLTSDAIGHKIAELKNSLGLVGGKGEETFEVVEQKVSVVASCGGNGTTSCTSNSSKTHCAAVAENKKDTKNYAATTSSLMLSNASVTLRGADGVGVGAKRRRVNKARSDDMMAADDLTAASSTNCGTSSQQAALDADRNVSLMKQAQNKGGNTSTGSSSSASLFDLAQLNMAQLDNILDDSTGSGPQGEENQTSKKVSKKKKKAQQHHNLNLDLGLGGGLGGAGGAPRDDQYGGLRQRNRNTGAAFAPDRLMTRKNDQKGKGKKGGGKKGKGKSGDANFRQKNR